MPTVLMTAPYMIPFLDRFKPVFAKHGLELIVPDVQERMEEDDLLKYAGQFDGAVCGDDRYTARVLEAIDTIVANSETPPIIIIQGDHGPWLQPKDKRFWNLTAINFPDHQDKLYSTITPVNIFRLVFNTYFGGKYDILEDVSYFSPVPYLYDFSKVSNSCNN